MTDKSVRIFVSSSFAGAIRCGKIDGNFCISSELTVVAELGAVIKSERLSMFHFFYCSLKLDTYAAFTLRFQLSESHVAGLSVNQREDIARMFVTLNQVSFEIA